jgi:hypothetical protein
MGAAELPPRWGCYCRCRSSRHQLHSDTSAEPGILGCGPDRAGNRCVASGPVHICGGGRDPQRGTPRDRRPLAARDADLFPRRLSRRGAVHRPLRSDSNSCHAQRALAFGCDVGRALLCGAVGTSRGSGFCPGKPSLVPKPPVLEGSARHLHSVGAGGCPGVQHRLLDMGFVVRAQLQLVGAWRWSRCGNAGPDASVTKERRPERASRRVSLPRRITAFQRKRQSKLARQLQQSSAPRLSRREWSCFEPSIASNLVFGERSPILIGEIRRRDLPD